MQGELDELEREEFFRLKKVQAKKKRDAVAKDVEVTSQLCVNSARCYHSRHKEAHKPHHRCQAALSINPGCRLQIPCNSLVARVNAGNRNTRTCSASPG